MQQNTYTEDQAKAKAWAEAKARSKRDFIFGAIAAVLIVGLIYMMFIIEDYGQRTMPGANATVQDAPDDH